MEPMVTEDPAMNPDNPYEVLGRQIVGELSGQPAVGVDNDMLIKAAEELSKTGLTEGAAALEKKYGKKPPTGTKTDDKALTLSRSSSSENFFTKKLGPIPVWGYFVGGGVALTGLVLLIKSFKK